LVGVFDEIGVVVDALKGRTHPLGRITPKPPNWYHFAILSRHQPATSKVATHPNELNGTDIPVPTPPLQHEELCLGLELIQLMEDVFLDLRLDDFWEHPDNRGWAILFMRWARSPRFRQVWNQTHRTFGIRFEYFCAARLGLSRDNPIVRV
jgi:hypothetical protein